MLKSWLSSVRKTLANTPVARRKRSPARPEQLESRVVPAVVVWDGGGPIDNWSDPVNWIRGGVNDSGAPQNGDDVVIAAGVNVQFDVGGVTLNSITFGAAGVTITQVGGGSITVTDNINNFAGTNNVINVPILLATNGTFNLNIQLDSGNNPTALAFGPLGTINAAAGTTPTLNINTVSNLAQTDGGRVTFGAAIGNNNALEAVVFAGAGGHQGSVVFNEQTAADSVTTTGNQTWNDSILLQANTQFVSTGGGDILFNDPLDVNNTKAATINSFDATNLGQLVVETDGNITFEAQLGNTTPLNRVETRGNSADEAGTTTFAFDGTPDDQNPDPFSSPTQISVSTRTEQVNGLFTTGSQTYRNVVLLADDTFLQNRPLNTGAAAGSQTNPIGNIIFESTVDGVGGQEDILRIDNSGTTEFFEDVGLTDRIARLLTDDVANTPNGVDRTIIGHPTIVDPVSVNTDFDQTYNDAVLLRDDVTLSQIDTVHPDDPLFQLYLLGFITSNPDTEPNLPMIGFNNAVNSTSGNWHLTINSQAVVRFGDGSNATGDDNVGTLSALQSLTTDAGGFTYFNVDSPTQTSASLVTIDFQTYNDDVVLNETTILESLGVQTVADIFFHQSVTQFPGTNSINDTDLEALTVNTGADTFFGDGDTFDIVDLASLTTDHPDSFSQGGLTRFNITNPLTDVLTSGAQTYNDGVRLISSIDFQSLGTVNGDINFFGNDNGALDTDDLSATLQSAVILTAGFTRFFEDVGVHRRLATLLTDAPGTTQFRDRDLGDPTNELQILTNDFQDYGDNVQLDIITNFDNNTGGRMFFQGSINSTNAQNLGAIRVNSDGSISFGNGSGVDHIGGINELRFVETSGGGAVQFNITNSTLATPSVKTDGHQQYDTRVQLVLDTVIFSNNVPGPSDLVFTKHIDNFLPNTPRKLSVNGGGTTHFGGRVGTLDNPLASLFIDEPGYADAPGVTRFHVANTSEAQPTVVTRGIQRYGDAVKLSADTILTSTNAGNIEFHSSIDEIQDQLLGSNLTVNTAGNTDFGDGVFNDHVGAVGALDSITTDAAGATRFNIRNSGNPGQTLPESVSTTGDQTYNDLAILQAYTSLDSTAGNVRFNNRITGPFLLTVDLTLSGPWFETTSNNAQVKLIQDGTFIYMIDRFGNKQVGTVNDAVNPTAGTISGLGNFTVSGDVITFTNGTRWERTSLTGYFTANGKLATVVQNGDSLLFTNENGLVSEGRFTTHGQAIADSFGNLTANVVGRTLVFANNTTWTPFVLSPTYQFKGLTTRVVFDGLNITVINERGESSTATLINPTTIRANQWNLTGQITQGTIRWANNTVWTKNLTIVGTNQFGQQVRLNMTNTSYRAFGPNNTQSNVRAISRTNLSAFNTSATINGNRILFANGQIWTFNQRDIDALYSDIQRFPFPA